MDTIACWPVANDDTFLEKEVGVYPNPVHDELTVVLPDDLAQRASVYFYDLAGHFLRKHSVRKGRNVLRVSDFPAGMLFYMVVSNQRILRHGKLVKN